MGLDSQGFFLSPDLNSATALYPALYDQTALHMVILMTVDHRLTVND